MTAADAAGAPTPRRRTPGFEWLQVDPRLERLRDGGWRGGVDQDGRPGPADIFDTAASRAARIRAAGYRGELGDDGYPSATAPTGGTDPGVVEGHIGPLEIGGVYRWGAPDADAFAPFRVIAIDANPHPTWRGVAAYVEDPDGEIRTVSSYYQPGTGDEIVTLYSPSHPDDPYAYEIGWTERMERAVDVQDPEDDGERPALRERRARLEQARDRDPLVSRSDPQTPAGHEPGGSTTAKEHNGMTQMTEATTHESAQAAIAELRAHVENTATHAELIVNGLQASGINGETITALYAVLEAINGASTAAQNSLDIYNRTQGQLAEAAQAAGADAAASTAYYTG